MHWDSRRHPLIIEVVDTGPCLVQSEVPNANASSDPQSAIGFKPLLPICNRAVGRQRKRILVGLEEGGSSSKGKRCKSCGIWPPLENL